MEDINNIKDRLRQIIEPVVKDSFMDLVEIDIAQGRYIRVIIDKTGSNVSLDDCSFISKIIGEMQEIADILEGDFSLEVSSPGINRPLRKKEDFERFRSKKARIVTKEPTEKGTFIEGFIREISGDAVTIETGKDEVVISFDNIKKANLEEELF